MSTPRVLHSDIARTGAGGAPARSRSGVGDADTGSVLHSWAAWRALTQLIRNPFNSEKTPHGLDADDGVAPDHEHLTPAVPLIALAPRPESVAADSEPVGVGS